MHKPDTNKNPLIKSRLLSLYIGTLECPASSKEVKVSLSSEELDDII